MTSRLDKILYWPAVGFGLGLVPVAPGTFGSLLGPPLVWLVREFIPHPGIQWLAAVALILIGVPICNAGSRVIGKKDPGSVVWDEIVAFFLVYAFVPVTLPNLILGFILFRLFDITKPWPIKRIEKLPEGWGVMADDLIAGIDAGILLMLIGLMEIW